MKIVLDCNVIISAGLTNGKCREVVKTVLTNHTNYILDEIVREYRNVIQRKKFEIYKLYLISILESVCLASLWEKNILSNEFNLPKYKANDEDDRKYLDLALSVNANYLITGNVKDFPLKNYHFLEVIFPDKFLELPDINK